MAITITLEVTEETLQDLAAQKEVVVKAVLVCKKERSKKAILDESWNRHRLKNVI